MPRYRGRTHRGDAESRTTPPLRVAIAGPEGAGASDRRGRAVAAVAHGVTPVDWGAGQGGLLPCGRGAKTALAAVAGRAQSVS